MDCGCNSNNKTKSWKVKNPDGTSQKFTGQHAESEARLAASKTGGRAVPLTK